MTWRTPTFVIALAAGLAIGPVIPFAVAIAIALAITCRKPLTAHRPEGDAA